MKTRRPGFGVSAIAAILPFPKQTDRTQRPEGVDQPDVPDYDSQGMDTPAPYGRDAVKLPRVSIARMMVLVGVVAVDIAATRSLFAYNSEMLIGVALGVIALQIGLFRLIRGQGRARVFWSGFIAAGLMAMMTFVWAMMFPEILGLTSTGALVRTPGSTLYTVWHGYSSFVAEHVIMPLLYDPRINPGIDGDSILGGLFIAGIRSVVWFLPQLLMAVVGGLLARGIAGRRRKINATAPGPVPGHNPKSPLSGLLSAKITEVPSPGR
jgi:hypothetical protein